MTAILCQDEVAEALAEKRPVVALETAVLTHGLPRTPFEAANADLPADFDRHAPTNLAAAIAMRQAVRAAGATPATIAIIHGVLCIGLDDQELEALADDERAVKASVSSMAPIIAGGGTAGTTVSATLAACALAPGGAIRHFATGGIGGVHRGWTTRPDVSADLKELAATAACVVCSGAKSVLDIPATIEALETLGIPVVGFGTNTFPRFHALGDRRDALAARADDPATIARICNAQWNALGRDAGVLVVQPVPAAFAMVQSELAETVATAEASAAARKVHGSDRTPFLLAELSQLTGGRSLSANIGLLVANARLAARIAVAASAPTPGTDVP